jgi:signal peptidase II
MQTTPGTPLTAQESAPARSGRPVIGLWLSIVVAVYALDQVTKWWAERELADGRSRPLIGDLLQLHLAHNPGAAFSTGTGYTVVLTVIALVVVAVIIRLAGRLRSRAWAVALGLVLGGALGNVTDRLFRDPAPFRGHVVDFLELPHWPIFNVADTAISCAAVLFVLLSLKGIRLDGTRIDEPPHEAPGPTAQHPSAS